MNLCHEDTACRTLRHEYLREGINFVSCAEAREMEKREKNLGKGRMLMMAMLGSQKIQNSQQEFA